MLSFSNRHDHVFGWMSKVSRGYDTVLTEVVYINLFDGSFDDFHQPPRKLSRRTLADSG